MAWQGPQASRTALPWGPADTAGLVLLLLLASGLRWLFFTGFYGSDEVTYLESAVGVLDGSWPPSDYIGSLRYGVNIPMAAFMQLFGVSELAAGLWGLCTSVGEVALVFVAARLFWGRPASWLAALCLALMPLHVHFAGRLMADAPLAFFLTLLFVSTWMAEQRGQRVAYLAAGLALGSLYWLKDAVFFLSLPMLGLYVLLFRRWHWRWLWMALGALLVVLASCTLMWKVHGDFFHLYTVGQRSLGRLGPGSSTAPGYYLGYLLLDIRHTFLLFFLALGGVLLMLRDAAGRRGLLARPEGFVLLWAGGFLVALSLLKLRQVNYMLIFAAPLALLAGYFLAQLRPVAQRALLSLLLLGGLVLSAFEQQAVQAFVANSRATVTFAQAHPQALVFASTGATRADTYDRLLASQPLPAPPLQSLTRLNEVLAGDIAPQWPGPGSAISEAYAVMDPQTMGWGHRENSNWEPRLASTCLSRAAGVDFTPAPMGSGRHVVDATLALARGLPEALSRPITAKLLATLRPRPATVFRVQLPCAATATALAQTLK